MNIYYIGGSPCSGKSTIAELIAKEYDLFYFPVDESLGRYTSMGTEKGYPVCSRQWKGGPDEIWLRDVSLQCREELQFYREIFGFIQEDLQSVSDGRDIITEGAAFLPELIKNSGIAGNCYICITPERDFQIEHYSRREWVPIMLEGCSDKKKAFENWMERDVLFAKKVREQCEEAGYMSIITDGKKSVTEMKEIVCGRFGVNGKSKQ